MVELFFKLLVRIMSLILILLLGVVLWYTLSPNTKYKDLVPERYSPFRNFNVCDNLPDAYNTQQYYMQNPEVYPTGINYIRALALNNRKAFDLVRKQRQTIIKEYAK